MEMNTIAPQNGLFDLDAKIIRFTTEEDIKSDPLRMLHAYRLAATCDVDIHPDSINIIRSHAPKLSQVARKRIRDEFFKILEAQNSTKYVRAMDETGLLSQILPEVESMRGVEQNAYHHLDIWEHTLLALELFEEEVIPGCLSRYEGKIKEYLDYKLVYGKRKIQFLKLALLLHDIGKPPTKSVGESGWIRFVGHEHVGAQLANDIVMRLRAGGKGAKLVSSITRNHLRTMHLTKHKNLTKRMLVRFIRDVRHDWIGVLLASYFDMQASKGPLRTREEEVKLEKIIGWVADIYFQELLPKMHPGRLVTKDELIAEFNLPPEFPVGKMLKRIEDLQFTGDIKTRKKALKVAKDFLEDLSRFS